MGCQATKGSFSSRVMWRRRGGLVSYQYYDGKKKRCGVDAPWRGATIAPGRWSKITVYMRVNTPGAFPKLAAECVRRSGVGWHPAELRLLWL